MNDWGTSRPGPVIGHCLRARSTHPPVGPFRCARMAVPDATRPLTDWAFMNKQTRSPVTGPGRVMFESFMNDSP